MMSGVSLSQLNFLGIKFFTETERVNLSNITTHFIQLQIYIYYHLLRYAKKACIQPVFSHKTPTPPDLMLLSSGSLSLVDIKQRRKEHLERMCSPSSNQPVVAACVKFGNVSR